jgi:hypothetical protein
VAIQTNVSSSFIFTGGDNVAPNWQVLDFDAVGAIDGEDINPSGIAGSNISSAGQGQVLTSDGIGGLSFSTPQAGSEVVRNGSAIEYVALDIQNLPVATGTGDVALLTGPNQYVKDNPPFGANFDLASAVLTNQVNPVRSATGDLVWNNDGTKLFTNENDFFSGETVELSASTPYDITTLTETTSVAAEDSQSRGIAFNDDGTKMYETGESGGGTIYQFDLSTAFDISTRTLVQSVSAKANTPQSITWNNDGTKVYEADKAGDPFVQSTVATPFDIGNITVEKTLATNANGLVIEFNDDGTKFFNFDNQTGNIQQYELSSAFEIDTATLTETFPSEDSSGERGFAFDANGERLFEVVTFNDIFEYTLKGGGWETF